MPQARFQSQLGAPVIDEANGIIRGCRIATLGAESTARDGEGRGLKMDAPTISALFRLAQERGGKVPAYFTHDWFDKDEDPLNFDAGVWTEFAIQDGNLTATFNAFETQYKAGIFSRAKADAESIAVSPIFDYEPRNSKSKSLCNPLSFISADFVKYGAINNALLKKQIAKNSMEDQDFFDKLKTYCATPEGKEMIRGAIEGHDTAMNDDAAAAEMESAAGVSDEDKKEEDKQKPALMRAVLRSNRAISRRIKASPSAVNEDTLIAKLKTVVAAEVTGIIGKGGLIRDTSVTTNQDAETFIASQLANGCPNRATAILRMGKDKPELYDKYREQKH